MEHTSRRLVGHAIRFVVAAGLIIDAIVHFRLAPGYQLANPAGIGQGNLFRVEAVIALAAAVVVLLRGRRLSYLFAALVAITALGAVVVTRYAQIPSFGPIPSMYEPVWFFQKSLSAVAEGVAGLVALLAAAFGSRRKTEPEPTVPHESAKRPGG